MTTTPTTPGRSPGQDAAARCPGQLHGQRRGVLRLLPLRAGRGADLPEGVLPGRRRAGCAGDVVRDLRRRLFARPVGAFVLGHFGDRIGRRRVLMFTIILMGISTFAIGCLPTYATAGYLGLGLLVLCRLLQGFSAAGEQAGASSLTLEHAPDHQRAFFTSWTLTGTQGGLILASLVLIPFVSLPDAAEMSWGWRVPFWLSAVVVAGGLLHPPQAARDPGVRRGQGRGHHREDAAQAAAAGPLARRAARHLLRVHRRGLNGFRHPGHRLRQEGRPRCRHHALAGGGRQRLRPRYPAAVRHARRPDRPQAGVHLRSAVRGGADAVLHALDERRQHTS